MEKVSDYDVLRRHHRFVRDDDAEDESSWEDRVARNYESKLFREYALIDLKHYKSNRYALRWRTASEVVDGIGDETCAGLRCEKHKIPTRTEAFELPFVYIEDGERKETEVKVRLCKRCAAKLTWKPREEREEREERGRDREERDRRDRREGERGERSRERDRNEKRDRDERRRDSGHRRREDDRRRRDGRERSPRRR